MAKITKTLRYFRCLDDASHPFDLESYVRFARGNVNTVAASEWRLVDEVVRIQHYRDSEGVLLHFVRYVPGESSDTLTPGAQQEEDNEEPHPAPEGMEYKDGDFFLLCRGHNLIGVSHGRSMNHSKIEQYLKYYIQLGTITEDTPEGVEYNFHISTALNIAKFQLMEKHGVSRIGFKASAYSASYDSRREGSFVRRAISTIGDSLKTRFERLDSVSEMEAMEDLVVEASIRLSGNTRAGESAQSELMQIAQESVDDSNIIIYTQKNEPISSSDIRLQTKESFDKHGKSVNYDEIWNKLKVYYNKLKAEHLLGQ